LELSIQTQQRYLHAKAEALPLDLKAMPSQLLTTIHLSSQHTPGPQVLELSIQTQQRYLQAMALELASNLKAMPSPLVTVVHLT
jgi:hypothetical protein